MKTDRIDAALVDALDAVLPQTQCRRCGYDACRPYAEALVAGESDLNRCPPGGPATIAALASLLRKPARTLDPACGEHAPREVALIDEQWCIGCTLCIRACPVDAIVGARRLMHAVIADECSGCELCLAPCPVDCIHMVTAPPVATPDQPADGWFAPWSTAQASRSRDRYEAREQRLARRREQTARRRAKAQIESGASTNRQAEVLAAVQRVRARRALTGRGEAK